MEEAASVCDYEKVSNITFYIVLTEFEITSRG